MNCLLEGIAGFYIAGVRLVAPKSLLPDDDDDDDGSAQSNLESCLASLHGRENELNDSVARLGREALLCKRGGDMQGARSRLQERRRVQKRVDRLRSSGHMIASQLDLLRNQELDRELMQSLKLSASTLKRSGASMQVKTAEDVMTEFEEQYNEVNELSTVLSQPIGLAECADFDLEQELAELEGELEAERVAPALESQALPFQRPVLPEVPFQKPVLQPARVTNALPVAA